MQRINSGEVMQALPEQAEQQAVYVNGSAATPSKSRTNSHRKPSSQHGSATSGVLQLLVCVGGIYASFLTWGLLQERITTTAFEPEPSGLEPAPAQEFFRFPIFLNTIQSLFAFVSGSLYLTATAPSSSMLPARAAFLPLLMIAVTQTLASPFGYASLAHVDYLTFVLAKSCKLLPVMFLHVTFYRKRYPLSKYLIVAAVTTGVAIFTLYHPPKPGKSPRGPAKSSYYGLSLLAINLLFDGLTNTTQDHIFSSPARYGRVTSSQMMAITNFYATAMMAVYLLVTPHIPTELLPAFAQTSNIHELSSALAFLQRHPSVLYDVLGFALCGAIGQLFIFATLERFSSLLLVTVTVTRKMLTMVLSVVWYGKSLTGGQWAGVGLVFGGIGTEAYISAQEKKAKQKAKAGTAKAQ